MIKALDDDFFVQCFNVSFEHRMSFVYIRTIALFSLMIFSISAHGVAQASIVRSTNGTPVLSSNGNCVTSNWEGSDDCAAAKGETSDAAKPASIKTTREAVVYFAFNKSTLSPLAKHRLDRLARKLQGRKHKTAVSVDMTVIGYADRLGNENYNKDLGMKRAQAVRDYLLHKGVKATRIEVRSLGKTDPKTHCSDDLERAKLIDCLKKDRRVEVDIMDHK